MGVCFIFCKAPEPHWTEVVHTYAFGWGVALVVPFLRGPGDALLEVALGEDWEEKNRADWRRRIASCCGFCKSESKKKTSASPRATMTNPAQRGKARRQGEEEEQRIRASALGSGGGRVTMEDLSLRASTQSWERTRELAGLGTCMALLLGLMRLLLWHLLQPCVFVVAIGLYADRVRQASYHWWVAACILAVREGWYAAMALACALVQPSYLLVDVSSSWQRRRRRVDGEWALAASGPHRERPAVLTYIFSPEKLVIGWLTRALHAMGGWRRRYLIKPVCVISFCALLAGELVGCATVAAAAADAELLGAQLARESSMREFWALPLPVRIGFGLTAAATLSSLAGLGSVAVDSYLQATTVVAICAVTLGLISQLPAVAEATESFGDAVGSFFDELMLDLAGSGKGGKG